MKLHYSASIESLKDLVGTLGYLLTLVVSLGLWFGIYAAISISIPEDQQNYVDAIIVDEKIDVEELEAFFVEGDTASVVQLK